MYLILMLEICIITVIVKGHVYWWKYHPCINQYNKVQTLHRNEDIYALKGEHIAIFEPHLFSSSVEHCNQMLTVTNVPVNSAALQQLMQCVTLILILVDTGLKELYLPLFNWNTLYNVMGVKTYLSVNLPQSVSISGAEIKLTLRPVTTYVLCCNLAPSISALKMCIFSNVVMK